MLTLSTSALRAILAAGAFAVLAASGHALADPPDRVARMSYIRGDVGFQPGGSGEWVDAVINRPLIAGDRLATDRDSRVELEVGSGSIRIDERSTVGLLSLDDRITQIELVDGTLNLSIRRTLAGKSYEINTPTLAFVVSEPGEYRVDVAPDGDSSMVTVFRGNGDVYGEARASYRVRDGRSYRFNDSALRDYEVLDLPRADEFDRWCMERNDRYERSISSRYVSDEVIGYADLDNYGSWSSVDTYGSIWYPSNVGVDWAPYRSGNWSWIDPWGWSWIDEQPWGFAPFHYGRWVQVSNRWGWVPGPRHLRPVYAPALVAFVGGGNWGISISSNPVGWFPLGPLDVYRPWYTCSRDYFHRVNVGGSRIINNTTIVNVYNDYSRGRPFRGDYTYRRDARAFTAVPGDVFAGGRHVGRDRMRINSDMVGRGNVINHVGIGPNRDSFGRRDNARFSPNDRRFDRQVVARNRPAAPMLPVDQRERKIRDNDNRPLSMDQLRRQAGADQRHDPRFRIVDNDASRGPRELPTAGATRGSGRDDRLRQQPGRDADGRNRFGNRDAASPDTREGESGDRRLPSSRYSPSQRQAMEPDARRSDDRRWASDGQRTQQDQRDAVAERQRVQQDEREQRMQRQRDDAYARRQAQQEQDNATVERQRAQQGDREQRMQRQRDDAYARRQAQQEQDNVMAERQRAQQGDREQRMQRQRDDAYARRQAQQDQNNVMAERQRAQQGDREQRMQRQRDEQYARQQARQDQRNAMAERQRAQQEEREQRMQRQSDEQYARQQSQQLQRNAMIEQQRAQQADREQRMQRQREDQFARQQNQQQQRNAMFEQQRAQQMQQRAAQEQQRAQYAQRMQEQRSRQPSAPPPQESRRGNRESKGEPQQVDDR